MFSDSQKKLGEKKKVFHFQKSKFGPRWASLFLPRHAFLLHGAGLLGDGLARRGIRAAGELPMRAQSTPHAISLDVSSPDARAEVLPWAWAGSADFSA